MGDSSSGNQDPKRETSEQLQAKWEAVARQIQYTATDRQIYFLLSLGVEPKDLQGITKSQASELIDKHIQGL